jgi:hypothetical protein
MEISKWYENTRFSVDVLREAIEAFRAKTNNGKPAWSVHMSVEVGDSKLEHDSFKEFLADCRKAHGVVFYQENN